MSISELVSSMQLKDSITLTLNSEFLNQNFEVVRQCLLRIEGLEQQLGSSSENAASLEGRVRRLEDGLHLHAQGLLASQEKLEELAGNVGDDFMKKMYAIEARTREMFGFEETARRLEGLGRFVLAERFEEARAEMQRGVERAQEWRDELERYLPVAAFEQQQLQQQRSLAEKQRLIEECSREGQRLAALIASLGASVAAAELTVQQSSAMIREIDFPEQLEKLRRVREEMEGRVGELAAKLRRKVGQGELLALESTMVERLDKFLGEERGRAEKAETKQALLFLERRINGLEDLLRADGEDKDALFSLKKWQCASCSKDLGKFEGRMGQYRPWSIFPCKQLDPEKSGGFGYLNYIDKMAFRRGLEGEEQALDRLSRTIYDGRDKDSPAKKLASTRGSSIINNFGSEEGPSLKEAYFKEQSERRSSAPRIFRVSKKEVKPLEDGKEGKQQRQSP